VTRILLRPRCRPQRRVPPPEPGLSQKRRAPDRSQSTCRHLLKAFQPPALLQPPGSASKESRFSSPSPTLRPAGSVAVARSRPSDPLGTSARNRARSGAPCPSTASPRTPGRDHQGPRTHWPRRLHVVPASRQTSPERARLPRPTAGPNAQGASNVRQISVCRSTVAPALTAIRGRVTLSLWSLLSQYFRNHRDTRR
jgi:hypothetical protein